MPDDFRKWMPDPEVWKKKIREQLTEVKEKEKKKDPVAKLIDFLEVTMEWEEFDEEMQKEGEKP